MTPLLVIALGAAALATGVALLLSFGRGYRVGRLLGSAVEVSIGEAARIAAAGERRYVRVHGRIDSDAEFEDADHRPLVFRRTRIESRSRGPIVSWRTVDEVRQAVPFRLNEGLDTIDVDDTALDVGLVVVPRRSEGLASELPPAVSVDVPGSTPVRLTVEQVSSVEHAIVLGVPATTADGRTLMTAGGGRPLVLTTLEIPEAMRILTGGALARSRAAAALLVVGAAVLAIGLGWLVVAEIATPAVALAASPIPSVLPGSDTRSPGEGPGLVGDPLLALLGVVGIAVLAVLTTLAYVRFTPPSKER